MEEIGEELKEEKISIIKSKKKQKESEINSLNLWYNLPPALSKEESARLLEEYRKYGDMEAREKFIIGNLRLVAKFIHIYGKNYVGRIDQINPSFEDLLQIGTEIFIKCVDDPNLKNQFSFATILSYRIRSEMGHLKSYVIAGKRKAEVKSLDEQSSEEDDRTRHDLVSDDMFNVEKIHDQLDLKYIIEEILPQLTKRERGLFEDYFLNGKTLEKLDLLQTREANRLTVEKIREKVLKLYEEGVSSEERELRGLDYTKYELDVLRIGRGFLKKFGREYLTEVFLPKLPDGQAKIFNSAVLNFSCQNEDYYRSATDTFRILSRIAEKLKMEEPSYQRYLKEQKDTPTKQKQRVERNKRLVEENGGEVFLRKYFVSTLPEGEKKVFVQTVLNYTHGNLDKIAKNLDMTQNQLSVVLNKVLKKLETFDFETVVGVVDNVEREKRGVSHYSSDFMEKTKIRQEMVKEYGGEEVLINYFLPILPEKQKLIFTNFFLRPKYFSYQDASENLGITMAYIMSAEKKIIEKLQSTDFEEIKKIQKKVTRYLNSESIHSRAGYHKNKSLKLRQESIKEWGGMEFLMEKFMPTLPNDALKIFFSEFYTRDIDDKELRIRLKNKNLPVHYKNYAINLIKEKLIEFKNSFEDFDQAVRDFYIKKEYDQNHTEEEKVEKESWEKKTRGRKLLSEEEIEKFGGEKFILKDFSRTLKSAVLQLIVYQSIVEKKTLSEIEENLNLSKTEMNNYRKDIKVKLENYYNEQKERGKVK